jgi:diguanylate cyclase (GGDEF)-like protein/PAS domain S-box-containing protein
MTATHAPRAKTQAGEQTVCCAEDLLMNAPVGVFSSTPAGRFDYVNLAFARIFGYESPGQMIEAVTDIATQLYVDPEDRKAFKSLVEKNRDHLNHECRFVRRNGSLFWASYTVRAVRQADGTIACYQGFMFDVTQQRLERESLLRTQFATDKAPDSILWVDHEGRIVYANQAACRSMGYSNEELLSMTVFDIDPDFPAERWEQHKEDVRRHGSLTFEARHRTKDGRLFPVEVSTNHFYYNDLYLACVFDRDITKRKQDEKALRESEEKYRLLAEAVSDIIWTLDLNLNTTFVTPSITKVLGYTPEERMRMEASAIMAPDSFARAIAILAEELERERNGHADPDRSRNLEIEFYHKDGHSVWTENWLRGVRDPEGRLVGIHGVSRDINERKQAERALRESEEKFRGLVEGLNEALFHMTLPDGRYTYVSPAAIDVLGYSAQEILDNPLLIRNAMHPDFKEFFNRHFEKILGGEVPPLMEYRIIDATGNERWILQSNKGVFDSQGRIVAIEGLCRDITHTRQAEERLQILSDNIPYSFIYQIVVAVDGRWRFTHVSAGVERLHGVTAEAVVADPMVLYDQICDEDRIRLATAEARALKGMTVLSIDIAFRTPQADLKWAHVRSTPRRLADGTIVWDGIETDITDRKRVEDALSRSENRYRALSIIDDLTQLYNSRHFYNQLQMEFNRSDRYEQPLSLLILDIDDFKSFNDTYGHLQGDEVLSRFGKVVRKLLRQTDSAYRYGGEEFAVILPMTKSAQGVVTAERIRADLKEECYASVSGAHVCITVSIGVGQYRPGEEMKAFVERVDQLMYQAKKEGKDRVCCDAREHNHE